MANKTVTTKSKIKPKAKHAKVFNAKFKLKPITRKSVKSLPKKSSPKVYYVLNHNFEFYQELKSLILKASPAERGEMIDKIHKLGRIKLAVASGIFMNETIPAEMADLFIVGDDIDKQKLARFLRGLEASMGQEIRFTLMDKEEFKYRFGMFDRFVRMLLEGPHEKLIDRLGV